MGLPKEVYTRIWRKEPGCYLLEAVNLGEKDAQWNVSMANGKALSVSKEGVPAGILKAAAGETVLYTMQFDPDIDLWEEYRK